MESWETSCKSNCKLDQKIQWSQEAISMPLHLCFVAVLRVKPRTICAPMALLWTTAPETGYFNSSHCWGDHTHLLKRCHASVIQSRRISPQRAVLPLEYVALIDNMKNLEQFLALSPHPYLDITAIQNCWGPLDICASILSHASHCLGHSLSECTARASSPSLPSSSPTCPALGKLYMAMTWGRH